LIGGSRRSARHIESQRWVVAPLFVTIDLFDMALHLAQQGRKRAAFGDGLGVKRPCLKAWLSPFAVPGDLPPCIRQRPFSIAGDWHEFPALVRAQRGLKCVGNLLCMGLFLRLRVIPTPRKPERLATLVANLKPNDLAPDESVAFDFSYALVRGGTLPEPLYRLAVKTFGQHGTSELIYLVGLYALVSTTLNGFNVPVPERE
jgi:hypothetical protein